MKNRKLALASLVIFCSAFFLRYSNQNFPFWVDEFSTAEQAKLMMKYGLEVFSQRTHYFESNNILTHFLTALSFTALGVGEWQARFPMMIAGSLVPVVLFIYARKHLSQTTALMSVLLYTFSYWQLTWARQARGYVLQQLFLLLFLYTYQEIIRKFSLLKLLLLSMISILGLLTHTTFILVLVAVFFHFILFHKSKWKNLLLHKNLLIFISIIIISITYFSGQLASVMSNLRNVIFNPVNNVAYYHSFLWREQTLITFLASIGILFLFFKRKEYQNACLLFFPIIGYLFFVSFLFSPYVSRYVLPIFPLLILLSSFGISEIGEMISKKRRVLCSVVLASFIILNGDTFSFKPRQYFSVNRDMREIALVDYDQVYGLVISKGELEAGQTAVIDPWPDRLKWYLGPTQEYFYSFRWLQAEGLVNGLTKETVYEVNIKGEKYIPKTGDPAIKLVGELPDLLKVLTAYPRGFIWIDDSSLPADVIQYSQNNFKKELYLEHYSLDDNPYSIWPASLYSWGFDTPNPYYQSATRSATLE